MYGAKLYGRNVEPVLKVYTEYLGDKVMQGAHYSVRVSTCVRACWADIVKCQVNQGGITKHIVLVFEIVQEGGLFYSSERGKKINHKYFWKYYLK